MAKTQLADIIVPAQFAGYVLQRTAEKSDLFQSGIVIRTPDYDTRAALGGTQVNMPHWNDLTGKDVVAAVRRLREKARLSTSASRLRILPCALVGFAGDGVQVGFSRIHQSGPFSTCMHRADAATVSYNEATVSPNGALLSYHAGSLCIRGATKPLKLSLKLENYSFNNLSYAT